jgi:hypothetical protein
MECLGLHNKPKAAVLAGAIMLTGPREEEEEEEEEEVACYVFKLEDVDKKFLLCFCVVECCVRELWPR